MSPSAFLLSVLASLGMQRAATTEDMACLQLPARNAIEPIFPEASALPSLAEDSYDFIDTAGDHDRTLLTLEVAGEVSFRIAGLYNTGTNYLRVLLEQNFANAVWEGTPMDKASGYPVENPPNGSLYNCRFYKHTQLSIAAEKTDAMAGCDDPNIVVVAIARSPLAWLNSFSHEAYELHKCGPSEAGSSTEAPWYAKSCSYPGLLREGMMEDPHRQGATHKCMAGVAYDNVGEIWSHWMKGAERMADFGIRKGILITFEDLVLDTAGTLAKIAELAGLPFNAEDMQQIEVSQNPQDKVDDMHALQVEKICARDYLQALGGDAPGMCALLDGSLLERHAYASDCGGKSEDRFCSGREN